LNLLSLVMFALVGCSGGGSAILVQRGTVETERDLRADLRTVLAKYPVDWGTACSRDLVLSDSQNASLLATGEAALTPPPDKTEDASAKRIVAIIREECGAHHWGTPTP
jgi:hypothetical protein